MTTAHIETTILKSYRVQMVSAGIPAYQNDFADKDAALAAANSLACGARIEKVASDDLIRYEGKKSIVRAFSLDNSGAA